MTYSGGLLPNHCSIPASPGARWEDVETAQAGSYSVWGLCWWAACGRRHGPAVPLTGPWACLRAGWTAESSCRLFPRHMATVSQKHRCKAERSPCTLDVLRQVDVLVVFIHSEICRHLIVLLSFTCILAALNLTFRTVHKRLCALPCVASLGDMRMLGL